MGVNETQLAQKVIQMGAFTSVFTLKPEQEKATLALGQEETLLQTMEECSELIAACHQYRRAALMKGQPTPKTAAKAMANLKEELVDSIVCIKELIMILGIDYDELEKIEREKTDRTVRRLGL